MTSEARFLIDSVVLTLGGVLPVCTWLFAALKGGPPERLGASLFGTSIIITSIFEVSTGQATPVMQELFFDTAVAVGFLVLAIRYNSLWLGAAMMVKGLQLAIHATHLTDGQDPYFLGFNLYAASLNLICLVICGILIAGTIASMRVRAKGRGAEGRQDPPLMLDARKRVISPLPPG